MKRYREDERRALVGDFESSGMSAAAFCRQVGITAVTLAIICQAHNLLTEVRQALTADPWSAATFMS